MAWIFAVNCRATSGYVTDTSPETYSLANTDSAYPVSRGGFTFGYTSVYGDAERNRNNAIDRRFAGIHQCANSTQSVFRVDLPATGLYTVRLAMGDYNNDQLHWFEVFDNVTSKFSTSNVLSTATNFLDANGTSRSVAAWPGSNTPKTGVSFASTTFILKYGGNGVGVGNSALAHLYIEQEVTAVSMLSCLGAG